MELLSFIINLVLLGMVIWVVFTWLVSRHLENQLDSVLQELDEERLIPLTVLNNAIPTSLPLSMMVMRLRCVPSKVN